MLRSVALFSLAAIAVQAKKLSARDAVCATTCDNSQQSILQSLAGDVIVVNLSNGNQCSYATVSASDTSVVFDDETYSFDSQNGCYAPDNESYSHDDYTRLTSCDGVFVDAECNADGTDHGGIYLIITRAAAESDGAENCIAKALQQLSDESDFNVDMSDLASCLPSDSADCQGLGNGLGCIVSGVLGLLDLNGLAGGLLGGL